MKLHEALNQLNEQELLDRIQELYPKVENIEGYRKVIHELRTIEPEPTPYLLELETIPISDFNQSEYVSVSGHIPGDPESYAIEFNDWAEWLNMRFTEESLQEFPTLDAVAHCLWEMTFVGFSREKVNSEADSLALRFEEAKNQMKQEDESAEE